MSIVLTGGGTGGHLAIIAAVKEHLKGNYIYIGSSRGQDRAWFEDDKTFKRSYFLDSKGVMNKGVLGKVFALFGIVKEAFRARKILKENGAKVLFCVGGYSAAPASIAALTLGIPLVIHEQNAAIGRLNRTLKPFAKAFISSYHDDSPLKIYPVKKVFFDLARKREELKSILIIGGSQGAVALNKLALELAPKLTQKGIKIFHQAGEKNLKSVKEQYVKMGIEAEVFGFTKELPSIMQQCDFAIARAGASTLWELVANGLPALFVPYPFAADNHQYYNAKFLVDSGLAYLIEEKSLNLNDVIAILENCDLSSKSEKLLNLIEPNGAKEIAELLDSYNTPQQLHN